MNLATVLARLNAAARTNRLRVLDIAHESLGEAKRTLEDLTTARIPFVSGRVHGTWRVISTSPILGTRPLPAAQAQRALQELLAVEALPGERR